MTYDSTCACHKRCHDRLGWRVPSRQPEHLCSDPCVAEPGERPIVAYPLATGRPLKSMCRIICINTNCMVQGANDPHQHVLAGPPCARMKNLELRSEGGKVGRNIVPSAAVCRRGVWLTGDNSLCGASPQGNVRIAFARCIAARSLALRGDNAEVRIHGKVCGH